MMILLFFLGASIASFLTLVVERYPNESILFPRSHCNQCQLPLKWYLLIPIFSQLLTGFRCKYCSAKIPIQYFILELGIGSLTGLAGLNILPYDLIILIVFSIYLSLFDLKSQSYPLLFWCLFHLIILLLKPITPLFLLFCFIGIIADYYPINIGSGDFLYLATLAIWVPLIQLLWMIQLASLIGILTFLVEKKRQKSIPFVPILFVSYLMVTCYTFFK